MMDLMLCSAGTTAMRNLPALAPTGTLGPASATFFTPDPPFPREREREMDQFRRRAQSNRRPLQALSSLTCVFRNMIVIVL